MKKLSSALLLVLFLVPTFVLAAEDESEEPETRLNADTLSGLALRGIGPAINSGRVTHFAVTPGKRHRYFVATASGGLWKTENAGTTWTPVFDGEGSYSIGTVTIDPSNPSVIWVGTGENNSQRSVSFGDGVYKSMDGGQTWSNVGLKESEHVGRIEVDPRDSDVVYVAAMGPLWRSGGDRGLYKSTDGGENWAFTKPRTAAPPGSGFSTSRTIPVSPKYGSTPGTLTSSTPPPTSAGGMSGR